MDSETGPGEESLAQAKDKLVLLVEDDEGQLELLKFLLDKEGFRVASISNGRLALKVVEEQNPDLIVLDLMLPDLSGYEVLRELQAAGHGSIPVVVLTARNMDRMTVETIRREPNVKEFLQKPANSTFGPLLHQLLKTRF